MTLFDVLRYPLSDIPTHEEFARMPDDLISKMFDIFGVRKDISTRAFNIKLLSNHIYYGYLWRSERDIPNTDKIKQARKAIAEYEPI
jgi:hypothetical protein